MKRRSLAEIERDYLAQVLRRVVETATDRTDAIGDCHLARVHWIAGFAGEALASYQEHARTIRKHEQIRRQWKRLDEAAAAAGVKP